MKKEHLQKESMIVFLAMIWGGGGPYTMSQVIHAYDWINKAIPSREEFEYAINYLAENNLIIVSESKYSVPKQVGSDFEKFRKTHKRSKFEVVKMYFDNIKPSDIDIIKIKISENAYKHELGKFRKFMQS